MSRFARQWRTFYFEEPLFDASDRPWLELRVGPDRLVVCVPHLLPGMVNGSVHAAMRRVLDGFLAAFDLRPDVLWFYTPMALEFTAHLDAPLVVYDCMDELSAFRGAPSELPELEAELLRRADLVFAGGRSLYEVKRRLHPNVHAFPSSVDTPHFMQARGTGRNTAFGEGLSARPRLGYYGVIDERIDLGLIERIADERPGWELVMIGPVVKIDPATLPQRPNLHWYGKRAYGDLPGYVAGWDVALMPFALNDATRFISPTKTLEYLAAGRAIVSTPIADVVRPFGEQGLVSIADADGFVAAIERALAAPPDLVAYDAFLARTSWDRTFDAMRALLAGTRGANV